ALAWRGCACRVVVRDLLRPRRVANVKDANARVEEAAGERRRIVLVVHATVVAAVGEDGQACQVGQDLSAVLRIVRFQHNPRYELRMLLVADVYDSRHWEERIARRACRLPAGE